MGEKRGRKEGGKRGAVCEKIHRWHSASAQRAWVRLADVYASHTPRFRHRNESAGEQREEWEDEPWRTKPNVKARTT